MAQLYVMCSGPGNTCFIYSRLATSLRFLKIIRPSYDSTVLSSTSATISTNIPSYEAIHRCMPLHFVFLDVAKVQDNKEKDVKTLEKS